VTHPLQTFIDDYTRQLEPLLFARNEAHWIFSTQGDESAQAESARLNTVIRQLHADPERFAALKALSANPTGDPLLDRQAELMRHSFQSQQMPHELIEQIVTIETAIESQFNAFRAEFNGQRVTDNDLKVVLRDSDDSTERYAAWAAAKQIGAQVVDQLLEVVALRNQAAHAMGFANYYSLSLELQELNEAQLFELFDRLEALTRPLFAAYKADLDGQLADRFGVTVDQLRPWHYADPFFQEVPADPTLNLDRYFEQQDVVELTRQFYQAIGLPIDAILTRSDLYERPGKYQHAYCQDMDRKGDTRVVCNVKPDHYWMSTMLHEYGHAVYDKYHDAALPFLLREPAHILSTEAIAMLMGRLSDNGEWLQRYAGVIRDEATRIEPHLQRQQRATLLIFTRWALTVCNFERELYRNPQQDLNTLWWNLVEKFQLLKRPENRHAPDWAAKIHLACYPAYYQNYLLGEMTASQLLEFITTRVLNGDAAAFIDSPRVGEFLRSQFFSLGSRHTWNGALQAATGEELKPEYFAKHLA
jgi:peptidyl-dipeptidase A